MLKKTHNINNYYEVEHNYMHEVKMIMAYGLMTIIDWLLSNKYKNPKSSKNLYPNPYFYSF